MAYEKWQDVVPQEGKQEAVFRMIANNEVDFMLMGGSRGGGKSELLTMIPLLYCQDPGFRGVFLRREYSEIMGANGIWEKTQNMYPLFKATPNITDKMWKFPSKSNVRMRHLFHENDKESFRGQGYSFIGIDEIDQFSEGSVQFLMTCLRSEAKMNSFMVGTLNPSKSWCLHLVEYYLNDEGFPDPDKFGDIRWFVVKDGEFLFGPSEEYFKENHPECVYIQLPNQEEPIYVRPKRFTFCFFSVMDNKALLDANPVYVSELQNLPDHERMTQLYGNWYAEPSGQSLWKRTWVRGENGEKVKSVRDIPQGIKWFRATDKGYSEPNDVYKSPDFTATSCKIGKDRDGQYWLVGDFIDEYTDTEQLKLQPKERVLGRVRKLAGERDTILIKQAKFDGDDTTWIFTKDTGGAATDHRYTLARFQENNLKVKEDKSAHNTPNKKLVMFQPFCQACSLGLVNIVESTFNKATLDAIYNELENFDPDIKSHSTRKDDWVDSHSICFMTVSSTRTVNIVPRNQTQSASLAADIINNHDVSIKETPQDRGIDLNGRR